MSTDATITRCAAEMADTLGGVLKCARARLSHVNIDVSTDELNELIRELRDLRINLSNWEITLSRIIVGLNSIIVDLNEATIKYNAAKAEFTSTEKCINEFINNDGEQGAQNDEL